ncbi:MAG: GTP-dependent dephospho-CoA kinase [Archaeoglobi archaeon]|nr:GTP-dependent dephospho-CoA kinase [Archaeoglobi archaeon]MDK2782294.1 GTP-dependent dephospho-CoA kinase [Archaeoglobi archaeon]
MREIVIPEWMREVLREPLGDLYSGCNAMESIKKDYGDPENLITVGDVVSASAITSWRVPELCVVDYRSKRSEISSELREIIAKVELKEVRVRNPPGRITAELVEAIKRGMREKGVKILVEGEEDLATLPAVLLAPESSIVLYGQPDKGVVVIKVDEREKEKLRELFRRIEIEDEEVDENLKIFWSGEHGDRDC